MMQPEMATEITEEGIASLHLRGRIDLRRAGSLWGEIRSLLDSARPKKLIFDCGEVTTIDTAGVVLMREVENLCRERGVDFTRQNIPPHIDQFLQYARRHAPVPQQLADLSRPGFISRLGRRYLEKWVGLGRMVRYVGSVALASGRILLRPKKLRLAETLRHLQMAGTEAVPLVCALSALMGMIMVFQGTLKMQNFGANIYIADMVGIAVTREMAPLLTAVILAGRSGAAFAAEIGSMKLNQELDALEVMDFDIPGFLVLPRVLAMAAAGPLLTLLADAAGILGGMITSHAVLGLPTISFLQEIQRALSPPDLYTGMIKGGAFAVMIGLTGCFCGLRTRMTANSVGIQTTTAVVIGILFIILADGLFAGIFQMYGW